MSKIKTTKNLKDDWKKVKNKRRGTKGGIYLSNIPIKPIKLKEEK